VRTSCSFNEDNVEDLESAYDGFVPRTRPVSRREQLSDERQRGGVGE
jgi:hypothetical protein